MIRPSGPRWAQAAVTWGNPVAPGCGHLGHPVAPGCHAVRYVW